MDPQTVDIFTADLYFSLLSVHNDNLSKYSKTIVTDYSLNLSTGSKTRRAGLLLCCSIENRDVWHKIQKKFPGIPLQQE